MKLRTLFKRWLFIPKYSLAFAWDENYGSEKRTGWSVGCDGIYLSQLEPWLVVALVKALWRRATLWDDESIG